MERKDLIIWLCLLAILQQLSSVAALTGHVCPTTYTSKERRTTACGLFGWDRCSRYYVAYKTVQRCCDGWQMAPNESCIIPICSTPCYNGGTCVSPELCKCQTSYSGQYCASLLCSYRHPCYPGACIPTDGCTCSQGYGGGSSYTTRCLAFTSENPEPTIDNCEHTFAHVRPTDNRQMFHFRSICHAISSTDVYWTNHALINRMEFTLTSSYRHVANMPPRPAYVSASGFGIVKMRVNVLHTKVNKNGGVANVAYNHDYLCTNGTSPGTPVSPTSVCSIKEGNYATILEHGDNLTATFITNSGGFRNLRNTDTNSHYTTDYFQGRQTQKKIMLRIDFTAPVHCSIVTVKCPNGVLEPLHLDEDITKNPINVTWGGWLDDLSGISYYYLELFLLSPNIHGDLVEMKPLQPLLLSRTSVSNASSVLSYVFTPPEVGMYSVLLQASDHANNSRIARRLVLYDNASSLTITKPGFVVTKDVDSDEAMAGDGGMYVTTAVAETGYRWQASSKVSSTHFLLDWQNHFQNLLHKQKGLLRKVLPYPAQFQDLVDGGIIRRPKVVDSELDDKEGRRTREPISNINGVIKFQFKDMSTADRTEPTSGWLDLPLAEQYSFQRNMTHSNFLRLWIKATDVLNNTITDYTEVHIDNTPPMYSHGKLIINVPHRTYNHTSMVTMDAEDIESGVHKLGFDIHVENQTVPLKSGVVMANRNKDKDACRTDTKCRCTSLDQCFLPEQTLYLDNCWFMVPKEELDSSATVTVHVYNQALLKTSFSLPIKRLSDLGGLEKYSGPTNIRVVKKLPNEVRLAWELPPKASCYGRADIVLQLYRPGENISVHYIHNEATTYDLEGLEPNVEYKMSLNLQNNGTNVAALSFTFKTASEENDLSGEDSDVAGLAPQDNYLSVGAIAGIVAGILVIIGLLIGVVAALLHRGHMQPVRKGLQAMSVSYQRKVASARHRVSNYSGLNGNNVEQDRRQISGLNQRHTGGQLPARRLSFLRTRHGERLGVL